MKSHAFPRKKRNQPSLMNFFEATCFGKTLKLQYAFAIDRAFLCATVKDAEIGVASCEQLTKTEVGPGFRPSKSK